MDKSVNLITCPICKKQAKKCNKNYFSEFSNTKYELYFCPNCHLEFWTPLKVIPEFYENEFLEMYKNIHLGKKYSLAIHHKPFFNNFPLKKGKLLDIGCGNGVFLWKAQKLGFEVYGIDFDKKSINSAKKRFKLENLYNMSLKEFVDFAQKYKLKFDIITFFEVLEHQDDPKGFLQDVKKILKPGGYIAGSVPNKARLFVNLERETTYIDYPPHHFLYFSKKSLKYFLESEGFTKIQFYPTKRPLFRLAAALEEMFLGKIIKNMRNQIKKFLLNEITEGKEEVEISIRSTKNYRKRKKYLNTMLINILRMLRNLTFLPLALLIAPVYNLKGYQIYFQAKLVSKIKENKKCTYLF